MSQKLYVGGLSYHTSQKALEEAFSEAGTVTSAIVITDKMTGRSKGFGFVEMSTEEEAQNAISMFDGKELDGRAVSVNEARPQEPRTDRPRGNFNRDSRGGSRGGFGGGERRNNNW
ncbi:MAG: RNA-binding protein [Patescibacteria group bacterium]|nr:RNA-binding protein [Patescibacteria group bacterium]